MGIAAIDSGRRRGRRVAAYVLLPTALLATLPAVIAAQACMGHPAQLGQASAFATARFSGAARAYSGTVHANLDGPFSLGATLGFLEMYETELYASGERTLLPGATLTMDLPVKAFPACAILRPERMTWSTRFAKYSALSIPIGVSGGTVISAWHAMRLLPSAEAGLLVVRASHHPRVGQRVRTQSTQDPYFAAGGTLVFHRFFARAWVSRSAREGATTSLGVRGGVLF